MIGKGGYGAVYRGKYIDKEIAIKHLDQNKRAVEIELQYSLNHHNVFNCLGHDFDGNFRYSTETNNYCHSFSNVLIQVFQFEIAGITSLTSVLAPLPICLSKDRKIQNCAKEC